MKYNLNGTIIPGRLIQGSPYQRTRNFLKKAYNITIEPVVRRYQVRKMLKSLNRAQRESDLEKN